MCGTFSSSTCPCEPDRRGERDTRENRTTMFSGGKPDIFGISRSTALRSPPNISSRKHGCLVLPMLFGSFLILSFSLPLSLLSFVGLSTCSHLRFWNYFISIRYRLLRISTRPVYRPLPLSKFCTVLPSCFEWTYPTSICPDPQCYNHQSAVLKSTIITSKYFINVINILFLTTSIRGIPN